MNTLIQSIRAWRSVRPHIRPGKPLTIPKTLAFPHPRDAGARPTISWPVGQIADYALELELGVPPLLIREFSDRFEAVVAGVDIAQSALTLIQNDPKAAVGLGGALVGAAIGTALTHKSEGAALGAALGVIAALFLDAHLQKQAIPQGNSNPLKSV